MNILRIILRILLGLLMVIPVLGTLGVFPPPTADLYKTAEAWEFIEAMMNTGYLMPLIGITFGVALVLIILNRMALAAILLAPLTVNIILFHLVLEGSLLTASALMADILLLLNAFFLWDNREKYRELW